MKTVAFHTFHSRWPHALLARFRYKATKRPKYALAYALMAGARKNGWRVSVAGRNDAGRADVAVFWSWVYPRAIESILASGRHVIIMERGFIQPRREWISLAVDGFNGRGKFAPAADGGERWRRHFAHHLRPWKSDGDYALLIGQIPRDRANPTLDGNAWAQEQTDRLRALGLRVRYRPHPWSYSDWCPAGAELSTASLEDDLAGAERAITFNSNAAVETILAGVPTIALDAGCIAYEMCSHSLEEALRRPDRTGWCHDMAWRQWSVDELEDGTAWAHTIRALTPVTP